MLEMYAAIPFSPRTALAASLGAADTVIPVEDVSAFPPAPNYATIGLDEGAETVLYTALTENALSGCTRGVEGTAKAWDKGEAVARNFTAADHAALIENVGELDGAMETHTHTKSQITDFPESMAPAAHNSTHAKGGADALTAEDIGASASGHTHTAAKITVLPATDYDTCRVRGISAGMEDLIAGESNLDSGTIYLVYE